jgi:predicted Zn-ribbon and HTH transcriptional regulator
MTKRYKVKRRDYPEICPKCGSKEIEHWGLDFVPSGLLQDPANCKRCAFTWVVSFKYQRWIPSTPHSEFTTKDEET